MSGVYAAVAVGGAAVVGGMASIYGARKASSATERIAAEQMAP